MAEILEGLDGQRWACHLVLTTKPLMPWPVIMRRFQSLMKWVRQAYGHVEYAAVKEEGKRTGMKHLHILLTGWQWVPYHRLVTAWEERTGAWAVSIRRVNGPQAALEAAKYVLKTEALVRKVVSFSRGWPRKPAPESLMISYHLDPPTPRPYVRECEDGTLVERWGKAGPCTCFGGGALDRDGIHVHLPRACDV